MPDALDATSTISPERHTAADALTDALNEPSAAWPDVTLRDHQIEALDQLSGRLSNGAMRTWVDAPTGSGKTIMFSALASAVGGAALVLVPRRNLAEQTEAAFARFFPDITIYTGPDYAGTNGVTITTYQAALRHAEKMNWSHLDLLICDEAHTALGAQTSRLLDRAESAVVVGFTATGSTTTGHVEQVFGPVSATLDRASAIERGILCPLRSLRVERSVDLSEVAITRGDFDQASLGRALDKAMWHKACADIWDSHFAELGLAGVAYTATVAQAHALADEMTARGIKAAAVSGQTSKRDLRQILKDFGEEKIDVLCNADLLTEGWDETRAAVVMHLAPTTSERVFVQRLGRVMRPAPDKEAVSVEFLPAGEKMGVQTSHEVFGLGWYQPLGRVAGPPPSSTGERGKLAKAAELLAAEDQLGPIMVNSGAAAGEIAGGLTDGGWRRADPGDLPATLMEEWVQAASAETNADEVTGMLNEGISPAGAAAWFALSGLLSRDATENRDQPLWRAWALALLTQPDLRTNLPAEVPRRVLDRLRMTARERLRALWWYADASDRWDRVSSLEQMGRSGDRRRWGALNEASEWAPAWAWDVSRSLADNNRPGRNQEMARIAAWEAHHLISNGGELALIATWLRSAGDPPPAPVPPNEDVSLRLGQAARLLVSLGRDDVPVRSEHVRLAARAAAACGGWAELRGFLDSIDFTTSDAQRSLRAAMGALHPRALHSKRAWNSLRKRFPRLPDADDVGVGEGRKRSNGRRRRRRRMRTDDAQTAGTNTHDSGNDENSGNATKADGPGEQEKKPRRRRRRRRRPRKGNQSDGQGGSSSATSSGNGSPPTASNDSGDTAGS